MCWNGLQKEPQIENSFEQLGIALTRVGIFGNPKLPTKLSLMTRVSFFWRVLSRQLSLWRRVALSPPMREPRFSRC